MGNIESSVGGAPSATRSPPLHGQPHVLLPPYPNWAAGTAPPPEQLALPVPVERHRAIAVHNGVTIKGDTLRLEPVADERGLILAFSFDADSPGRMTVYFFAKEDDEFILTTTKESMLKPVKVPFKEGHGQEFKQPYGGIDVSLFEESELTKVGEGGVFPLALKVEVAASSNQESEQNQESEATKCLIKLAVLVKKESGAYGVRFVQQSLWIDGRRYVFQEIFGHQNATEKTTNQDSSEACVICLAEPKDTAVLPCRHMVAYAGGVLKSTDFGQINVPYAGSVLNV
ncbi:hypothetical protein ACP70R_048730 [Stipagrostis hirtigluma subsp. patula]